MDIYSHVRELNGQRMAAANELRTHIDECHRRHPGKPMTAEERAKSDRINRRIDELEDQVHAIVSQETRERESAALREMNPAIFGSGAARSLDRIGEDGLLRSVLRGEIDRATGSRSYIDLDLARAAQERHLLRDGANASEIRSLLWDTGSVGSAVPRSMANTLYGYLEASSAMFRAPVTKINTSGGEPMDFPRFAAHAIGTQVSGQGTTLAGTDPTFAKLTLDAYKYGQLVQVSRETVDDAAIDIVNLVLRDMGRGLGRVIDTDLVVGSGSGKPNGIITATGLAGGAGTVATGGSLINATYENCIDAVHKVADEYRHSGSCGWLMLDATAGQLRKIRDGAGGTTGAVMWEPSLTAGLANGQPDRFLGYPVFADPNVAAQASAAKSIFFGDFSSYYLRTAGNVRLERSDDFAFSTDLVSLRAVMRVDGDLIDDKATTVISNRVA